MAIYNVSRQEYSASKPKERVTKTRPWFLILIIVGILALVLVWLLSFKSAAPELSSGIFGLPVVHAQDSTDTDTARPVNYRPIIMAGVFGILGIVYLAGIYKVFFSGSPDQVDMAVDLVKTLTGFFVGAATGFLG